MTAAFTPHLGRGVAPNGKARIKAVGPSGLGSPSMGGPGAEVASRTVLGNQHSEFTTLHVVDWASQPRMVTFASSC